MNGKGLKSVIGMGLLGLLLLNIGRAWGYLNNGWETNYIYATHGATGAIEIWTEVGVFTDTTVTSVDTYWYSLTFAGTGTNDARLFAAKFEPHWTVGTTKDARIVEFDTAGPDNIVAGQDVDLGDLLGVTDVYGQVMLGRIRYSSYHNSLFVSVSDESTSGNQGAAIYEIDLELTTILNTYSLSSYTAGGQVGIDINPNDGTLYVVATGLNSAVEEGDLIAFDTSGGSTTSYTTLIDSDTLVDPGNDYQAPRHVTYRGTNNPENAETVLISFKNGDQNDPLREYYLNQTDGSGNLLLRSTYLPTKERLVGQLDVLKESVWLASARNSTVGAGAGYHELTVTDTTGTFGDDWRKAVWWDIDSPGTVPGIGLPPIIDEVIPDPIEIPSGIPYTQQLTIVQGDPLITWSIVRAPPGMIVIGDNNGATISGWTPTDDDIGSTFDFEVRASNPYGDDIEAWMVLVFDGDLLNNGFRKDRVYQCIAPGGGGSRITTYRESDGSAAADPWHDGAWHSLTFAGTGDNDARLFVTKPDPYWSASQASHDAQIAEMDGTGAVTSQTWLSTLLGLGSGPGNIGDDVVAQKIRYSSYHNTLFVGLTKDLTGVGLIEVYEIDLGLTTILNMYTGPTATKPHVTLDINPDDGTLYVTSELLNNDGNPNKGDLIAFDTYGGSTSSYTTLIEATSLADPSWQAPYGLIYRGLNNPDRRPTILILMMGLTDDTPEPQLEFYLDQTDGNGYLVKRGEPFNLRRGSGGDLDLASRICWVTDAKGGGSIQGLLPNDSYFHPTTSGSGTDSASPPGTPVCNMDGVWADADKDGDVDQDDFAMFQACYTGVDGGILSNPVYCQCFNRDGDTDIDNDDFTPFQDCATGPAIPFDLNNPPVGCIP